MAIVKDENIRSGKPTLKDTRVTVSDIVETFYNAGRSVSEISEDFGITEEDVEEALRYRYSSSSSEAKA